MASLDNSLPGPTDSEVEGPYHGFAQAFAMIIASEIGDKTFLIAAILAMRHDRTVVFAGAFGSLFVMSVLSAGMGRFLPSLIPAHLTHFAAAGLFLVFGVKMVIEGRQMKDGNEKIQEELREVEEEIDESSALDGVPPRTNGNGRPIPLEELEEGRPTRSEHRRSSSITISSGLGRFRNRSPPPRLTQAPTPSSISASQRAQRLKTAFRNSCNLFFGPVFVQSFILTFLGEWGDRSQMATIALAAANNLYVVAFGTILGHGLCTAMAVIAGRWISKKISIKKVTLVGAALFLVFAVAYFIEGLALISGTPSGLSP